MYGIPLPNRFVAQKEEKNRSFILCLSTLCQVKPRVSSVLAITTNWIRSYPTTMYGRLFLPLIICHFIFNGEGEKLRIYTYPFTYTTTFNPLLSI